MVAIEYVINEYLYIAIGYWDISFSVVHEKHIYVVSIK